MYLTNKVKYFLLSCFYIFVSFLLDLFLELFNLYFSKGTSICNKFFLINYFFSFCSLKFFSFLNLKYFVFSKHCTNFFSFNFMFFFSLVFLPLLLCLSSSAINRYRYNQKYLTFSGYFS